MSDEFSHSLESLQDLITEMFDREYEQAWKELMTPKGQTGILGVFDEWARYNPSFTPKQFDLMWDSFTHREKVRYVKDLILPAYYIGP